MRRISMKARKVLGACTMLLSLGALAVTGVVAGAGAQEDPDGDTADTSADVDTKELCIWYVSGVEDGVALTPAAGADALYDGAEMALTSGDTLSDVEIFVSGNNPLAEAAGTIDAHRDCTFYGQNEGIAFKAALSGEGFIATGGATQLDPAMNFDQTVDLPFLYDATNSASCRSGADGGEDSWSSDDLTATSTAVVEATTIAALTKANTVAIQSDEDGENSACVVSQLVTVSIPVGQTPTYPGTDYSFEGPTLTFSFNIES
jgi:hypothetical protein